ncbi:hypothetical protein GGI15_004148 [Coemansia interrupta]|uniref:RRM domain-containing protein n=1 Tax=Coemansia interrupta TaxID=1126814 RepID=A0A9W8HBX5_9FUNG|nr:hypothetical protein GGI15_004148 [Coemansia interrupta]
MGKRILHVSGFSRDTRARELAHAFERYGRLVRCDIPSSRSNSVFAFVEYEDSRDADDAFDQMHDQYIGDSRISVQWAKRPPARSWRFESEGRRRRSRSRSRSPYGRRGRRGSRSRSPTRRRSPSPDYRRGGGSRRRYDSRERHESRGGRREYSRSPSRDRRDVSAGRRDESVGRRGRSPSPLPGSPRDERPRDDRSMSPVNRDMDDQRGSDANSERGAGDHSPRDNSPGPDADADAGAAPVVDEPSHSADYEDDE